MRGKHTRIFVVFTSFLFCCLLAEYEQQQQQQQPSLRPSKQEEDQEAEEEEHTLNMSDHLAKTIQSALDECEKIYATMKPGIVGRCVHSISHAHRCSLVFNSLPRAHKRKRKKNTHTHTHTYTHTRVRSLSTRSLSTPILTSFTPALFW
jgi:hypothetical protein